MKKTSESIAKLVSEKYAMDISNFSDVFLNNAIGSRILSTNSQSPGQYINYLEDDPGEIVKLTEALSNSYSTFFRNPLTFQTLNQFVLPKIINEKQKNHDSEIRIWSAGCAAGQEPYSLAIILNELISKKPGGIKLHIFATDNSSHELETACRGCYEFDNIKNLPLKYVDNYFSKSGDFYTINKCIRELVEFSNYDLLDENSSAPPASIFGDFDLIICCNVLLYYKPEIQKFIMEKFTRSTCNGGFLVTGAAEVGIVNTARTFRHYLAPAPVFVKN